MAETLVTSRDLAMIFGLTARRVEQLKTDGVIDGKGKPTKYELVPTVTKYIKYLSDKAYAREQKAASTDSAAAKLEAEARYKTAKADMAELELQELNGELHRAEDVEAIMTDNILLIRSMILALPSRLAVDVASAKTATEASDVIKKECYRMLDTMAAYEYDPAAYQTRVRERKGWTDKQVDEDDGEQS